MTEDGVFKKLAPTESELVPVSPVIAEKDKCIRELELELAQTKLALVESECRVGDLTHELNASLSALAESKNSWFQKTLTSLREVTKKDVKETVVKKDTSKEPGISRSFSRDSVGSNKDNGSTSC
jgi:hypothetical protein